MIWVIAFIFFFIYLFFWALLRISQKAPEVKTCLSCPWSRIAKRIMEEEALKNAKE